MVPHLQSEHRLHATLWRRGQPVFLLQGGQLAPGFVLYVDAIALALLHGAVLQLAGIENFAKSCGGWRLLEVGDKGRNIALKLVEWSEGVDLEDCQKGAVVMAPLWVNAKAEASEDTGQ